MTDGALSTRWPLKRARFIFSEANERGYDLPLASVTRDGGVEFRADLDISVWNPSDDVSGYKRVLPGDFVIGLRSFQSGLGYSPLKGLVSPAYSVLRLRRQDMDPRYLRHLFKSAVFVSRLENVAQGIRQGRTISFEDFGEIRLPVPPLSQQGSIADYLDFETDRINALCAAKWRLVALLSERLNAAVSEAVYARRAVDPASSLPGTWRTIPLRRCLRSTEYGIGEATQSEGPYAVLGMGNVQAGEVEGPPGGFVSDVLPDLLLQPDDLLFNRTNSRALVGKVGIVRSLDGPTTFASYLVRFKVNELIRAAYLNYLLNAREVLSLARSMALPSIGQANLNPNRFSTIVLPVPPLGVQDRIVAKLDGIRTRIVGLKLPLERQIDLLEERRETLVTAAVTGQLDIAEAI